MSKQHIAVIGAGQMGTGIVQVFLQHDFPVILQDIDEDRLTASRDHLARMFDKLVAKDKCTSDHAKAWLTHLTTTTQLPDCARAHVIIEAVPEIQALKKTLIQRIGEFARPEMILATNTSSLSIAALGADYRYPAQFIGMHFMNPVPLMPLIEVIAAPVTAPDTYQTVCALGQAIGKTIVTSQDHPGFILNRILIPMINEAIATLEDGVASAQDIDTAMMLGANHPMGPLALADLIGLDTVLSIMKVLHAGLKSDKYKPASLLEAHVVAGRLGRKSGQGFYEYKD